MGHIKRLLKNKKKKSVMDSRSQTIGVTRGRMSHDGRHAPPPDLDYEEVNHTLSGSFVRHQWSMPSKQLAQINFKASGNMCRDEFKTASRTTPTPHHSIVQLLILMLLVVCFRPQAVSYEKYYLSSQTSTW